MQGSRSCRFGALDCIVHKKMVKYSGWYQARGRSLYLFDFVGSYDIALSFLSLQVNRIVIVCLIRHLWPGS